MWRTPLEVYRDRLDALGFSGRGVVLDAGAGFGQWSVCLAERNESVYAIDASAARARFCRELAGALEIGNLHASRRSIERTGYRAGFFDAIFCYSVIYLTDWRVSLRELARVLRPGGTLYVCTNGLGWYLHNLFRDDTPRKVFDTRAMAVDAIANTLEYTRSAKRHPKHQLIMPSGWVREELEALGLKTLWCGPEGSYRVRGAGRRAKGFFQGDYFGQEGVYEIIAKKNGC